MEHDGNILRSVRTKKRFYGAFNDCIRACICQEVVQRNRNEFLSIKKRRLVLFFHAAFKCFITFHLVWWQAYLHDKFTFHEFCLSERIEIE